MKLAVLSLMLLAVACGQYESVSSGSQLGQVRAFSPAAVDPTTASQLSAICNALAQKSSILTSAIGSTHNFDAAQTTCEDVIVNMGIVQTTIQQFGDFQFRKTDGTSFIFPNVETDTSGIMQPICANLANLQTQFQTASEVTSVTTTGISPDDCTPLAGETCVLFESGPLSGQSFTVTTKEWVRFRVTNPNNQKIGFFTQRKKVSQSFCGNNQSIQYRASLQ